MKSPKLTVQLVTWNSADVVEGLLTSLKVQSFTDFDVVVVDNASRDDSVALVRKHFPKATFIANTANRGFSAAHNQAFAAATSSYAVVVNPDVVLTPEALASLVASLDADDRLGSVSGKMLQGEQGSVVIDGTGIVPTPWHKFINRGEGEIDAGQYDTPEAVFGNSGACVVYRRAALSTVAQDGEIFDEDFFAYQEDVDLAWRLLRMGWVHWYIPTTVGYHLRHARRTRAQAILAGRPYSALVRRLSYRNHLYLLWKNSRVRDWFSPLPLTILYEFGKVGFLLIREWRTIPALVTALRNLPRMLEKRQWMNVHAARPAFRVTRWPR